MNNYPFDAKMAKERIKTDRSRNRGGPFHAGSGHVPLTILQWQKRIEKYVTVITIGYSGETVHYESCEQFLLGLILNN